MTDLLAPPLQTIFFTVPGEVRGKNDPRSRVVEGTKVTGESYKFVSHYTDGKTRSYEAKIGSYAMVAKGKTHWNISDKPLKVYIEARFNIPESWSKKKKAAHVGALFCQKPDADNLMKCLDGLRGVLIVDDKQFCDVTIRKRYVSPDMPEGLYIRMEEVA